MDDTLRTASAVVYSRPVGKAVSRDQWISRDAIYLLSRRQRLTLERRNGGGRAQ